MALLLAPILVAAGLVASEESAGAATPLATPTPTATQHVYELGDTVTFQWPAVANAVGGYNYTVVGPGHYFRGVRTATSYSFTPTKTGRACIMNLFAKPQNNNGVYSISEKAEDVCVYVADPDASPPTVVSMAMSCIDLSSGTLKLTFTSMGAPKQNLFVSHSGVTEPILVNGNRWRHRITIKDIDVGWQLVSVRNAFGAEVSSQMFNVCGLGGDVPDPDPDFGFPSAPPSIDEGPDSGEKVTAIDVPSNKPSGPRPTHNGSDQDLCGDPDAFRLLPRDSHHDKAYIEFDRRGSIHTNEFELELRYEGGGWDELHSVSADYSAPKRHYFTIGNVPDSLFKRDYEIRVRAKGAGHHGLGSAEAICGVITGDELYVPFHPVEAELWAIADEIGLTGGIEGNPWWTGDRGQLDSMQLRPLSTSQQTALRAAIAARPDLIDTIRAAEEQFVVDDIRHYSYVYRMMPFAHIAGEAVLDRSGYSVNVLDELDGIDFFWNFVDTGAGLVEAGNDAWSRSVYNIEYHGNSMGLRIIGGFSNILTGIDAVNLYREARDPLQQTSTQDVFQVLGVGLGVLAMFSMSLGPMAMVAVVLISFVVSLLENTLDDPGRFEYKQSARLSEVRDKEHALNVFTLRTQRANMRDIVDGINLYLNPAQVTGNGARYWVSTPLAWDNSMFWTNTVVSIWSKVEPTSGQSYGVARWLDWDSDYNLDDLRIETTFTARDSPVRFAFEGDFTDAEDTWNPRGRPLAFGNVLSDLVLLENEMRDECDAAPGPVSVNECEAAGF